MAKGQCTSMCKNWIVSEQLTLSNPAISVTLNKTRLSNSPVIWVFPSQPLCRTIVIIRKDEKQVNVADHDDLQYEPYKFIALCFNILIIQCGCHLPTQGSNAKITRFFITANTWSELLHAQLLAKKTPTVAISNKYYHQNTIIYR